MFDILLAVLFVWLFFKALGLALRVAWGTAKVIAILLFAAAVPLAGACLLFAGGLLLLAPIALVALALGLLKACI